MTGKLAAAAAVAVLSLSAAAPALAGFRIEEVDLEFPKEVTVYWFQGGKARVDGALEGLTVIVDVKNGEGWLIDSASKRYAGGKIAELAEILKKVEGSLDNDAAPGDPAGRKAATEPAKPLAVVVKDLGAGERLQGYETRHFQVLRRRRSARGAVARPEDPGRQRDRPGRFRGRACRRCSAAGRG